MKRKTEKALLSQQMELLAEESKNPDETRDLEALSNAMCNIYKTLADKNVEEVANHSEPVTQLNRNVSRWTYKVIGEITKLEKKQEYYWGFIALLQVITLIMQVLIMKQ